MKRYTPDKTIDYFQTFVPVVRYNSIRYLIVMVAEYNLDIEQKDAATALFQGDLRYGPYIEVPLQIATGMQAEKGNLRI